MKSRQLWVPLLALVLVAAACAAEGGSSTEGAAPGDPAAFCSGWPQTRAALQADLGGNSEWEIRGAVTVARLTLNEADALVPTSIRADWVSAVSFQDTVITLLEIADYLPERLPEELIDAAFGEGGAEGAVAVSEVGIESVDTWALDECGDFCEMWPRLDSALGWTGAGGGNTDESIRNSGPQDEGIILLADALVPAAVRDDWDAAAGMKLRLIEFFGSPGLETLDNWERSQLLFEAFGFSEEAFQALLDELDDPPPDTPHEWWVADVVSRRHREAIGAWVADNCETVGVSGLPGVVRIEDSRNSPDQLFIAAVPVDADLQGVDDASDFLGVACSQQHPGEVWSSPLLERTSGFDQPCIQPYREDLGARPTLFPAGDYDLFVGSFPLGVGNFNTYVPAPERCVVVRFTVDGDTQIQVPNLELCDVGPLAGTVEEIARRQPATMTGGPTGTLRVRLTEHLSDQGIHVSYNLAVLPSGTTLNQVALGEVWPVGAGCLPMDRPLDSFVEDFLGDEPPGAEREAAEREAQFEAQREADERETEREAAQIAQLPPDEREAAEREVAERQAQREAERQAQREAEEREVAERQEEYLSAAAPFLEAIAGGGVPVPITPFPVDPESMECGGGPYEYLGLNDQWTGPEPAELPAGDYDVYVFVDLWNPDEDGSRQRCAVLTVSVSGETVVAAPPLEACS